MFWLEDKISARHLGGLPAVFARVLGRKKKSVTTASRITNPKVLDLSINFIETSFF
jgi:hypothetical protein